MLLSAYSATSARDLLAGKTKFGHVNLSLKRVLQGGRGDEVSFQNGRTRHGVLVTVQRHIDAPNYSDISSAPLDHELVGASGDFMHSTHVNPDSTAPQLLDFLKPAEVLAEHVEAVRDAPIEDLLQNTQWERAKRSLKRQEDLQQALAMSLPLADAQLPSPQGQHRESNTMDALLSLWPAGKVTVPESPYTPQAELHGVPASSKPAAVAAAASSSSGTPAAHSHAAPSTAAATETSTCFGDSSYSVAHVTEKLNVGVVGGQVKLCNAVLQAELSNKPQDGIITIQGPAHLEPSHLALDGSKQSGSMRGRLATGEHQAQVALSCKVKWSGQDGMLVVRGRLGTPPSEGAEALAGQCDLVIQLGQWLEGGAQLESVKASSGGVKLASNRHDVLWHIPPSDFRFGHEVALKAKCRATAAAPDAVQGSVEDTPWKARVRSERYTLKGEGWGTYAAHAFLRASGAGVQGTAVTEMVVVAKTNAV